MVNRFNSAVGPLGNKIIGWISNMEKTGGRENKYERLVFVTGPARSGTTLLNRILCSGNNHIQFPECTIITTIIKTMVRHNSATPDRFQAYFGSEDTKLQIYRTHIDNVISNLLRDQPHKFGLVLKDPDIALYFNEYRALFPEAYFVFIVRDPRDVVASRKDVVLRKNLEFTLDHVLETVKVDFNRMAARHRSLINDPQVAFVRYEDLVHSTEASIKYLENFVGTTLSRELNGQSNSKDNPFSTPISTSGRVSEDSAGSFQSRLTEAERDIAQNALAYQIRFADNVSHIGKT